MRIALIADVFPPLRSSGAVQLRDLSIEMVAQGHQVTVMIPASDIKSAWSEEDMRGVKVLRLRAPRTKDVGYVRRTLAELIMPFAMRWNMRKSEWADEKWDAVVWYSPTIFLGPLAAMLKSSSNCKAYLIIRDIFPVWVVDMDLMGKGLLYLFFKCIERFQYRVADVIGVQTPGNVPYFSKIRLNDKVEVLQNWLAEPVEGKCSIKIADTILSGRRIVVYAGNMGVAQGMDIVLELAKRFENRSDVGFLLVGRGSESERLRANSCEMGLSNIGFFNEIDPDVIPQLFAQCDVGIVSLDSRHKTHNIPGKFISYMQCGLPVLASVNAGNDMIDLVRSSGVGRVSSSYDAGDLACQLDQLLAEIAKGEDYSARCKGLAEERFSARAIVNQIVNSIRL